MTKPETIVTQHKGNFDNLSRAFEEGQVALVDCIEKKTGEHVAVICAVWVDGEGMYNLTPYAQFFNCNPYDKLMSPIEYSGGNDDQKTEGDPVQEG